MSLPTMALQTLTPGLREVEVVEIGEAPRVRVREAGAWEQEPFEAQWALERRPRIGQQALLAEGPDDRCFVVGVVAKSWPLSDEPVRVHASGGELLFEYDPNEDRGRIYLDAADVELATNAERLALSAPEELTLRARRVRVEGNEAATLVGGRDRGASLRVDRAGVALDGERCDMSFRHTELRSDRLGVTGEIAEGKFERTKLVAERIETIAHETTARARRAYHFVEEAIQTRAGRIRQIVKGSFLTRGGKVAIQSRKDVKVQGRQIKLG